jgi:S1-C subfamily serine protease
MLRLLKAVGIPFACLAALAAAVYLVWEADQRWERQRIERREMTGTARLEPPLASESATRPEISPGDIEQAVEAVDPEQAVGDAEERLADPPVLDAWESNGRTPQQLLQLDRPKPTEVDPSLGAAAQLSRESLTVEQLQERIRLATVRISHPELGPLGGGVVISRSRTGFEVLTANHVIDGMETIKITTFHRSDALGASGPSGTIQPAGRSSLMRLPTWR